MVAGLILPVAGLIATGLMAWYATSKFTSISQEASAGPFGDKTIWVMIVGVVCIGALLYVAVK